jgi:Tol biopolymer transport system component
VPGAYGGQHWSSEAKAFITRVEGGDAGQEIKGYVFRAELSGEIANLSSRNGGSSDAMVAWAPDGRRIVFVSTRQGDQLPQLYVMDADGSDVSKILTTPFEVQYPQWAPDGSAIAFTGVIDDGFELFTVTPDGTELTRLTETPEAENWPTWSADSSQIAFSANDEIWTMRADGTERRHVTSGAETGGEPNWSPDGELIAFDCGGEVAMICAIGPDGTGFTTLFRRAGFPFWIH